MRPGTCLTVLPLNALHGVSSPKVSSHSTSILGGPKPLFAPKTQAEGKGLPSLISWCQSPSTGEVGLNPGRIHRPSPAVPSVRVLTHGLREHYINQLYIGHFRHGRAPHTPHTYHTQVHRHTTTTSAIDLGLLPLHRAQRQSRHATRTSSYNGYLLVRIVHPWTIYLFTAS